MLDSDLSKLEDLDISDMSLLLMLGPLAGYAYNTTVREWIDVIPEIHKNTHVFRYIDIYRTYGYRETQKRLMDFVKENNIDVILFLDCTLGAEFQLSFLEELRKTVYTVINFGDIIIYFDDRYRYQAQPFDLVLVDEYCEKYRVQLYGFDTVYLPYCFDLDRYKNLPLEKDIDVSFIGRQDRLGRREYLTALKKHGTDLQLFGVGTENGPVSQEEMIRIFNRSRINLNFTGIAEYQFNRYAQPIDKRVRSVKGRCQEIALTGSFVLTEYAPGMDKAFDIGTEIDIFGDEEELLEKVDYYLTHEEIREKMAAKAYERALKIYDSKKGWLNILKIIYNRAKNKRYIPAKIYLDDNYLKVVSRQRATNLVHFVKQKKFDLAMEELRLMIDSKKIDPFGVLSTLFREVLRPVVHDNLLVKKLVAKIRGT